jgi:phenylacetate-coenzyme A ligase PaaK-like adenylate-forming protein
MEIEDLFRLAPYGLKKEAKNDILLTNLLHLTVRHCEFCEAYKNILSALAVNIEEIRDLSMLPFMPARLFKDFELRSIGEKEVFKVLTSSGTTSQRVSRIYLDKQTAMYQTRALVTIMQDFIGRKRLPMIIADSPAAIKDRRSFSARGAGILGMSNFGRDHFYLLDEQMRMDVAGLSEFLSRHGEEDILIFGFTFMLWQYVYKELLACAQKFDLGRAVLIHSGGWKKMTEDAVDNEVFKKSFMNVCGISRIYNFYGMVEQVGSIFMECEAGHFHAPNFADVLFRDPMNWNVLPPFQEGVAEVMSVLPFSYPGHVLLTEDIGMLLGEDDCRCGRNGKYFVIRGRVPETEIRGCSDVHAYEGSLNEL